jgi:hypothetical protein
MFSKVPSAIFFKEVRKAETDFLFNKGPSPLARFSGRDGDDLQMDK